MAKKKVLEQELAWWEKDSIVEIWVLMCPSDPNTYHAKCLTEGTFPILQVLDSQRQDKPHPKYSKPLRKGEYVIWGYVQSGTISNNIKTVKDLPNERSLNEDSFNENSSDEPYLEDCDFSFIW